jgi:hypothetical protein
VRNTPFLRRQLGFSLGGPIVRDRLRFFLTAETSRNETPAAGRSSTPSATTASSTRRRPTCASRRRSSTRSPSAPPTAGSRTWACPTQFGLVNPLLNTFARLDYQISAGNRLVVRNIYNDQKQDDFGRSTGTFNFTSNFFRRRERSNQVVAQLFSNLPAGVSNEAIVGYTATRFKRNPSVLQPQYVVQNIGGAGTGLNFRGGTENSSQGNELRENLFEFQDNLTIPRGAHTSRSARATRSTGLQRVPAELVRQLHVRQPGDWVSGARATQYSGSGTPRRPGGRPSSRRRSSAATCRTSGPSTRA